MIVYLFIFLPANNINIYTTDAFWVSHWILH